MIPSPNSLVQIVLYRKLLTFYGMVRVWSAAHWQELAYHA
jgi:hypothetical protein